MPALENDRLESFAWLMARDFMPLAAALGHAQAPFEASGDRRAALAELEAILLGEPENTAGHR